MWIWIAIIGGIVALFLGGGESSNPCADDPSQCGGDGSSGLDEDNKDWTP